jgi:hypothetical protein
MFGRFQRSRSNRDVLSLGSRHGGSHHGSVDYRISNNNGGGAAASVHSAESHPSRHSATSGPRHRRALPRAPAKGILKHATLADSLHGQEGTNHHHHNHRPFDEHSVATSQPSTMVTSASSPPSSPLQGATTPPVKGQSPASATLDNTTTHSRRVRRQMRRVHHHVAFGSVEVREYARTVGDNPSVSSGPPLAYVHCRTNRFCFGLLPTLVLTLIILPRSFVSLDWEYDPVEQRYTVNDYEAKQGPLRFRSELELAIPRDLREDLLHLEWNVSREAMAAAVRDVIRTKNQRRQTIHYDQTGWGKLDTSLQKGLRSVLGLKSVPETTDESATVRAQALVQQHEVARQLAATAAAENDEENDPLATLNPMHDDFDYAQYYTYQQRSTTGAGATLPTTDLDGSRRPPLDQEHRPKLSAYMPPPPPTAAALQTAAPDEAYLAMLAQKMWTSAPPTHRRRQSNDPESTAAPLSSSSRPTIVQVKSLGSGAQQLNRSRHSQTKASQQPVYPPTYSANTVPREIKSRFEFAIEHADGGFGYHNDDNDALLDDDDVSAITNGTGLFTAHNNNHRRAKMPVSR